MTHGHQPAAGTSPAQNQGSFETLVRLVERLADGSQAAAAKYEASADAFNASLSAALSALNNALELVKERDATIRSLEAKIQTGRDERRDHKNDADRRLSEMERELKTIRTADAELKATLTTMSTAVATLLGDFNPIKKAHDEREASKKKVILAVVIAAVLGLSTTIGGFIWVGLKLSLVTGG